MHSKLAFVTAALFTLTFAMPAPLRIPLPPHDIPHDVTHIPHDIPHAIPHILRPLHFQFPVCLISSLTGPLNTFVPVVPIQCVAPAVSWGKALSLRVRVAPRACPRTVLQLKFSAV
ncbi:hypothetical protein BDP27DRAFT_376992 [Rhodocollybia butyracea]|uniref:Uncharacterized protein n=1 Tax=Rhodocollybia butyracea TaxID=206335 RepID=A0A9P5PED7_9AGAR|nr:hypothetical protein BDP27DRAFT_376992 [Rhodocollybia butyracea]